MGLWTIFNIATFACCAIYFIADTNAQDVAVTVKGVSASQDANKDKLDPKTISEITGFVKDTKLFGEQGTKEVTKILDNKKKELEDALKTANKRSGSGRHFHGIISIIIPLIFSFSSLI